ncbi:MAG: TonB-dependent receptor, partial [Acidobacteria bacterium]
MKAKAPGVFTLCFALALVLLLGAPARAQIDTASIVGTVTDASGAVLAGATVTATQEGTGSSFTTMTNAKGQYVLPNLKIGRYTVTVELQGFKKAIRQAIQLHVQERLQTDFSLALGNVSEEVVVSGRAELLQTQT